MFEFLYLGRVIALAEKYPRETLAAITAVVAASYFADVKKEKVKAEAQRKSDEIRKECELIRYETAKLEAQNRQSE